jgi:hypothetical protein
LRLAPALLLLRLIGGGVYAATDADTKPTKIPFRPEDLSANVVTLVSPDDLGRDFRTNKIGA